MARTVDISGVTFLPVPDSLVRTGLLGWVRCVLNESLALDGLTLRRSATGRLYVSFPSRRDGRGRNHPLLRPLDAEARSAIEGQILEALEAQGVLA